MSIMSPIIKLIIIINVFIRFTIAQPTIIRCCFGSAIVENSKIYVGGGLTGGEDENIYTDDFFSFDLTVPFSTNNMHFDVHKNVPIKVIAHTLVYAKNAKGGNIYLFGGHRESPMGDPIYGYDPRLNAWSSITPKIRDGVKMPIESDTKIIGVTDSSLGTIYIFDNGTMFIYDVWNNFWDIGKTAPFSLHYYAAVMLNTSEIAYIGGYDDTSTVSMEQVKYQIQWIHTCVKNHFNEF